MLVIADETTSVGWRSVRRYLSTVEEPTSAPAVVVPPANGGASNMDVGVEQSFGASGGIADDAVPAPPQTPEAGRRRPHGCKLLLYLSSGVTRRVMRPSTTSLRSKLQVGVRFLRLLSPFHPCTHVRSIRLTGSTLFVRAESSLLKLLSADDFLTCALSLCRLSSQAAFGKLSAVETSTLHSDPTLLWPQIKDADARHILVGI